MGIAVGNGAICTCTFGAAPCPLTVTSTQKTQGTSLPFATIGDNTAANMSTFGMCSSMANPAVASATAAALGALTPQPCSPVITAPWQPGSPTVQIEGKPALTNSSKCMCAYAGVIGITNPAITTVQVP